MGIARRIAKLGRGAQIKSRPDRRLFGRIWPDGSASLAWPKERVEETDPLSTDELRLPSPAAPAANLVSSPDLSQCQEDKYNSPRSRRLPYGSKGMSGYGAKMVRSAGTLLQKKFGRKGVTMWTLTVPSLPAEARREVARQWGELERQLLQWLGRQLLKAGLPRQVVLISEIQVERLQRDDEAYLHFHVLMPARKLVGRGWAVSAYDLRRWWWSALNRVTHGQCTQQPRVNGELVRKSAAGYLAKYMSKGPGDIEHMIKDVGGDAIPRRWWSITKSMLRWVKREILEGPNVGAVLDGLRIILELSDYDVPEVSAFPIVVDVGGDSRLMAWAFSIWGSAFDDLTAMLKSA